MRAGSPYRRFAVLGLVVIPIAAIGGWSCGNSNKQSSTFGGGGNGSGAGLGNGGNGNGGGISTSSSNPTSTGPGGDPKTCAEAAKYHTYIGCDFYPTVIANPVWSIFDFAAVVANAGDTPATATVQQNGVTITSATVMPNSIATLYLPWVPALKGQDFDECGDGTGFTSSVVAPHAAYHLTTDQPVTVYQFSALEYQGAGGPPGKDWGSCPGNQPCATNLNQKPIGCFSYSNDASLLLPSTAMTGNYRVISHQAFTSFSVGDTLGITATEDGTSVKVSLSATAHVQMGVGIADTGPNGTLTLTMNQGDVVELTDSGTGDMSGSLVTANKPVQVISGVPCLYIPDCQNVQECGACDHIEETVFPAETLGKHYFVTRPTGPHGTPVKYQARLFGNVDGTTLTYPSGGQPIKGPPTINAGQVVDLGEIIADFEIKGDHEFGIATFLLGAVVINPGDASNAGDPSQSLPTAVEQYRDKYIFLAPTDYEVNFVDVVSPAANTVSIDGAMVPSTLFTPIGSSSFGIAHLKLINGSMGGGHVLTATAPVGIQVVGYGANTSYMYPGGLNLSHIAPPPVPK